MVTLLGAFFALGTVAMVFGPRGVQGGEASPLNQAARDSEHQRSINLVAGMIARSRAVLAYHDRLSGGFDEMVLWTEDRDSPGEIDPQEIGVITFSRVLQTLTYYRLSSKDLADAAMVSYGGFDAAFCHAWRTSPSVEGSLIGAGLSDVEFGPGPLIQAGGATMRISFTWVSESADAPDEASAIVGIVTRNGSFGAGE